MVQPLYPVLVCVMPVPSSMQTCLAICREQYLPTGTRGC
jgi:hypothetical protein